MVQPPDVQLDPNRVVLAPVEMRETITKIGEISEFITTKGDELSNAISVGLGDAQVWSSPKNKGTFQQTCEQLFVAINALIDSLDENRSNLETYVSEREDA